MRFFDDSLNKVKFEIYPLVRKKQLYGIEIKSTASVSQSDFNGLRRLAEIAGKKFQRGIVLYGGDQVVGGFGENLQAVPIPAVWAE